MSVEYTYFLDNFLNELRPAEEVRSKKGKEESNRTKKNVKMVGGKDPSSKGK